MSQLAPETAKMLFMTAARVEIEGAECFVRDPATPARTAMRFRCPRSGGCARPRPPGAGRSEADWARRARLASRGGLVPLRARHRYDHHPNRGKPYLGAVQGTPPGGARPGGYPGADVIARQLAEGVSRKGVGIRPDGKTPVREGAS